MTSDEGSQSYEASKLVKHIHEWPRYTWDADEGHLVYTTATFGFQVRYRTREIHLTTGTLSTNTRPYTTNVIHQLPTVRQH